MLEQINGWLAIPHEYLHVFAHRLIGKKCHYQVGKPYVTTIDSLSVWERFFVLLFPFLATFAVALGALVLWMIFYVTARYPIDPIDYFQSAPMWHQLLWLFGIFCLLYSGTSIGDLFKVIQLLLQNLRQQPPHQCNHQ